MRKRVLVAEASDTNRRVAETLLRQNGFEVISVARADKAREVLQFSRPDLLIVGGDLMSANQKPFFEEITSNPKFSTIPLMIFEPVEPVDLPFPPEVVIHLPFEPLEFVQRVTTFTGMANEPTGPNPLSAMTDDDSFLDAALGLDRIDVTDSEVMDRTSMLHSKAVQPAANVEKMVGYDHVEAEDTHGDSSKVESVMIRDDKTGQTKPAPQAPTATSKLEIMQDQYGLVDPSGFHPDAASGQHDYDWFINSMREEIGGTAKPQPPAQPNAVSVSESAKLRVQSRPLPADDPFADVGLDTGRTPATSGVGNPPKTAGVEKFIDEFKREIERIRSNEPDSIFIEEKRGSSDKDALNWEESLERLSSEQVELFTKQLASEIAEKIAQKIVSRIDPERLLQLIKAEVIAHIKEKHR